MNARPSSHSTSNPLHAGGAAWDELIEAIGPAAMLVRIESRMSEALKRSLAPEDIWQETLLHAWRDRERCEWKGLASFRQWLLRIAENRIRDAADRGGAQKRGGDAAALQARIADSSAGEGVELFHSTTPSRIAWHKEQAAAMREAVDALPELVREVVRLRLFEEHSPDEIARELGISHAAVKHRLRQGSALYRERLVAKLRLGASSFLPER